MARARNIKPGFFQNDELGELQPIARLLFIGLWTIADFKGCLEYRPKRIKAQILPYDDCDTDSLMSNLDKSGFISIYSVQGQQYVKITNFEKHQNPHKNEREAGTDIPDMDKKDSEINELKQDGNTPDKNGTARADSLILIPDSPIPHPETKKVKPTVPASAETAEVFEYWKTVMQHPAAQLDAKRSKAISGRLRDGYTVGQLCMAVDGCKYDPFSQGANDRRTVYDDIELICRDGPKVDKFINIASRGPQQSGGRTSNQQQTMDNLQAYLDRNT